MIPLGVLGGSVNVAAGAAPFEFVSARSVAGASSSLTIPSVALGDAGDALYVVVYGRAGAPLTVTLGGEALTKDGASFYSTGSNFFSFGQVTSPGGTGDVAVTFSATTYRAGVGIWRGPAATFSSAAIGSSSVSITGPSPGFVIVGNYSNNTTAVTFTGADERYDEAIPSGSSRWAVADTTTAGSLTISSTGASTPGLAAAAYAI